MIAANICAARFLKQHKIPALYRIHEGPNPDKVQGMVEFLAVYGVRMRVGDLQPEDYAEALQQVSDLPEFEMIQTVMLRSMLQASYSPDTKTGHFGLALQDYAHFTSPIRRYPDLLVHRGIRHVLQTRNQQPFVYDVNAMTALGESCSRFERRAEDATREAADWLKCEYLQKHVGQQFSGIVTSVTSFGMFVQLEDLMIDGLVHVTSLKRDYYQFDAVHHRLIGESSGRVYQLGDQVEVQVARVDMDERKIDFDLISSNHARFIGKDSKSSRAKRKKPSRDYPAGKSRKPRDKTGKGKGKRGKSSNRRKRK